MWDKHITVKQAAILLILGCLTSIGIAHGIGEQQKSSDAQSRYQFDVANYEGCVSRQKATQIGNKRAKVLRQFLHIAAQGRVEAAKEFIATGDPAQAKINFDTATTENQLAEQVDNTIYISCPVPPVPSGATEVDITPAPHNK